MKVLCWNCRGVGHRKKDIAIKDLIFRQKCGFLGLVETKHKELPDFKVRAWWGHSDVGWEDAVATDGAGWVITCWDLNKFERKGSKKGERFIMIHGILKEWGFECEIMVIYAPNDKEGRRLLWEELISTRTNSSHPLLVMGDFNEVRSIEERSGGSSCLASIEEFKD